MDKKPVTIKVWRGTLSKLRLLAGIKEQSVVSILDDLITKELENEKGTNKTW